MNNLKKDRIIEILLSLFVITFTGCIPSKMINLTSVPAGSRVYDNNQLIGKTPINIKMEFPGKENRVLRCTNEGYLDKPVVISYYPKELLNYEVKLEQKEVIQTELVEFIPLRTNQGVRLQRVVKKWRAFREIIERSPNVKAPQKVTANEDSTFQIGPPVVTPDGKSIVYWILAVEDPKIKKGLKSWSDTEGYSNIWKQPVSSYGRTQITKGNRLDLYPYITPDGEGVIFSSNRISENHTLWKASLKGGGGLPSITNSMAEDVSPCITPDNEEVVYTSIPPGASEPQIWKINSRGTLPTQLREGESPDVSPDNKIIVFTRKDRNLEVRRGAEVFNPDQIWTMGVDGIGETQLTQNTDHNCIQPRWSPDGKWIVFASDKGKDSQGNHNYDIWMMASDGTRQIQLTTNGSKDDSPFWSPDGSYIYFRSNRGWFWNLWRFQPLMPK